VAAAATAALEYRLQGLIALTGIRPLVDASPAVLSNTAADHYKFCYVVKAEDCYAGSIVGEIYFNVPFLTYPYTVPARFAPFPWSMVRDISFTQNTHTTQTLLQASAHRRDSYGTTVRRLTTGFAPYKVQSTFWNLRALPTGNRFFWGTKHLDEARDEILVADLPPFPGEQSLYRGNFVPVRLSLGGASGDEVRVRFGYSENGPAESLFCHERQVACSTSASGTQPYAWVDESPSWSNCSSGCSISVPAISGRVLYYVIDRRNGGVTSSSMLDAVAVP